MLPEVNINNKNFNKLDLSNLPTPCYVIDIEIVKQNLSLLRKIKEQSSVNVLLALKAFSLKKIGPLVSRYLDGTSASGLNEAKLARKYFSGIVICRYSLISHKKVWGMGVNLIGTCTFVRSMYMTAGAC